MQYQIYYQIYQLSHNPSENSTQKRNGSRVRAFAKKRAMILNQQILLYKLINHRYSKYQLMKISKTTYLLVLAVLVISSQAQSTTNTTDPYAGCRSANETTCLSCMDRFYMIFPSRSCLAVSTFCDGYNTTTGLCTSCGYGFVLDNGRCQPPPSTYTIVPVSVAILPNCAKMDSNGTNCIECSANYSLYQGRCYKTIVNCAAYSADGSCSQCLSNFSLIQGKCIKTIANCAAYYMDDGSCFQCATDFTLTLGKCVKSTPNCELYNTDSGSCNKCLVGYTLLNFKCYKIIPNCVAYYVQTQKCFKCAENFELSITGDSCKPVAISNCAEMNGTKCSKCLDGFLLTSLNTCVVKAKTCKIYSPEGVCLACDGNGTLVLTADGRCELASNVNTASSKINATYQAYNTPYCNSYDINGKCIKCSWGAYFDPTNTTCIQADPYCKNISTTGVCFECYSGYIVNNNRCVIDTNGYNDPYCALWENKNKCKKCSQGAYFNANMTCIMGDPYCMNMSSTGVCNACYKGYELKNNTCVIQQGGYADPLCSVYLTRFKCLKCSMGAHLDTNTSKCVMNDPLCKVFDDVKMGCTDCYPGYILNLKNQCVVDTTNCKTRDSNRVCTQCYDRYWLDNGVCRQISDFCKAYSTTTGACTDCYSGYKVNWVTGECYMA